MKKVLAIVLAIVLSVGFFSSCTIIAHDIVPNGLFSDNMVLQRDKNVPVFGLGYKEGAEVTVEFGEQKVSTVIKDGKWRIDLAPMEASFEPRTLKISCQKDIYEFKNVLVGEVWLCSGQSNMEWHTNWYEQNSVEKIQEIADNKNVRFCFIKPEKSSDYRKTVSPQNWVESSKKSVLDVSGYGAAFVLNMQPELNVPVGAVMAAEGSTAIASWLEIENDDLTTKTNFKSMIYPMFPFSFKGVIWYQGESDCMKNPNYTSDYPVQFQKMCDTWREGFENPDMPFITTQIASYVGCDTDIDNPYDNWSIMRRLQVEIAQTQKNVYVVPQLTFADKQSQIHPSIKHLTGEFAAKLALDRIYGKNIRGDYAYFESATIDSENNRVIIKLANTEGELKTTATRNIAELQICGTDGKFIPATGRVIDNSTFYVDIAGVDELKGVAYCARTYTRGNLFSGGTPVLNFLWTVED